MSADNSGKDQSRATGVSSVDELPDSLYFHEAEKEIASKTMEMQTEFLHRTQATYCESAYFLMVPISIWMESYT